MCLPGKMETCLPGKMETRPHGKGNIAMAPRQQRGEKTGSFAVILCRTLQVQPRDERLSNTEWAEPSHCALGCYSAFAPSSTAIKTKGSSNLSSKAGGRKYAVPKNNALIPKASPDGTVPSKSVKIPTPNNTVPVITPNQKPKW